MCAYTPAPLDTRGFVLPAWGAWACIPAPRFLPHSETTEQRVRMALNALTCASCRDACFCLEQAEFCGDSVLKVLVTMAEFAHRWVHGCVGAEVGVPGWQGACGHSWWQAGGGEGACMQLALVLLLGWVGACNACVRWPLLRRGPAHIISHVKVRSALT